MAEVVGGIASVLTIVESIAHVTKTLHSWAHATKESWRLVKELSYTRGILTLLKETIEDQDGSNDTSAAPVLLRSDNNGVVYQFQQLLDQLDRRINGPSSETGLRKVKQTLQWPLKESETLKLFSVVERFKQLINLALENDHMRLSREINGNIKVLTGDIREIKDSLHISIQRLESLNSNTGAIHEELQRNSQRIEGLYLTTNTISTQLQRNFEQFELLNERAKGMSSSRHLTLAMFLFHGHWIVSLWQLISLDTDSQNVFQQLSTWNFWDRNEDVLSQRAAGTGNWFLDHPEFTKWMNDEPRNLLCFGPPGVGKSVLASIVVDHLQSNLPPHCRILAFFVITQTNRVVNTKTSWALFFNRQSSISLQHGKSLSRCTNATVMAQDRGRTNSAFWEMKFDTL